MFNRPDPVHHLPDDYKQTYYLSITDSRNVVALNVLSVILLVVFAVLAAGWGEVVQGVRGAFTVQSRIPGVALFIAMLGVLVLHEFIHGITIRWAGYEPSYGMKGFKLGPVTIPYVLYATTKQEAYFRRTPYLIIALAPVTVITLGGMLLMVVVPDYMMNYLVGAIIINGAGAVGDLWMAWVLRHYPEDATLIKDEADAIRVFTQGETPVGSGSGKGYPEN